MAKNKTVETEQSVDAFLATIADEQKRADSASIIQLITEKTGIKPKMWGPSIVGFGSYTYRYESGRVGDAPLVGLSPRANALTFYLSANFDGREALLAQLGKHKTGKGCVYVQKLADIDTEILLKMVVDSMEHKKQLYPD